MKVYDLPTPSLLVDVHAFDRNVATMAKRWPGEKLRPHVKAFKSTALAARLAENGHRGFCCATVREMMGMAAAGLGDDLLLANESLDLTRLTSVIESGVGAHHGGRRLGGDDRRRGEGARARGADRRHGRACRAAGASRRTPGGSPTSPARRASACAA